MFETYTENARRVIFFARYEASQFGSSCIETEHLLLGLVREDKSLIHRFLPAQTEGVRQAIEAATVRREKVSTSVDMPLSEESKCVLGHAREEAESLKHKHIGTEHLLLGLLREQQCFAARILGDHGVRLSAVREALSRTMREEEEATPPREFVLLSDFSQYLTRMAREDRLLPLVGREEEFEQMVYILGRSGKNNVVLVGEPGVGKKAIVDELVRRVSAESGPAFLRGKLFVSIDLSMIVTAAQHSVRSREYLTAVTAELTQPNPKTVYFFNDLHHLLAAGQEGGAHEITLLLKPAMRSGALRCITSATPQEHQRAEEKNPWLKECLLPVMVRPADENEALKVLEIVKERFESFHGVRYTPQALEAAVALSNRFVKNQYLPDKAIDLIDGGGAIVKLEQEKAIFPEELKEGRKRLAFIVRRHEMALANNEFEKARFYADEQRTQRDTVTQLHRKYNIPVVHLVSREHIEEALARWTGVSLAAIRQSTSNAEIETRKAAARRKAAGNPKAKKKKPS